MMFCSFRAPEILKSESPSVMGKYVFVGKTAGGRIKNTHNRAINAVAAKATGKKYFFLKNLDNKNFTYTGKLAGASLFLDGVLLRVGVAATSPGR